MEKEQGKDGTVYIYFEVAKDGTIGNVKTQKGVAGAPGLGKEAERVIRAMPPWTPGKMNGRSVKVGMTVPVRFTLQ
jgi:protein TonB